MAWPDFPHSINRSAVLSFHCFRCFWHQFGTKYQHWLIDDHRGPRRPAVLEILYLERFS
jgi:hypothetical protein